MTATTRVSRGGIRDPGLRNPENFTNGTQLPAWRIISQLSLLPQLFCSRARSTGSFARRHCHTAAVEKQTPCHDFFAQRQPSGPCRDNNSRLLPPRGLKTLLRHRGALHANKLLLLLPQILLLVPPPPTDQHILPVVIQQTAHRTNNTNDTVYNHPRRRRGGRRRAQVKHHVAPRPQRPRHADPVRAPQTHEHEPSVAADSGATKRVFEPS